MKLLLLGFALLLFPSIALASGIQASPDKLQFEIQNNAETKNIVVANPTGDVQTFEIYPDSLEQSISVSPSSFTLEAGNRKTVSVTVQPNKLSSGVFTTTLSVVGKPITTSQVQVNTGLKIPLTISTHKPWYSKLLLPVLISVIVAAAIGNYFKQRKQKSRS